MIWLIPLVTFLFVAGICLSLVYAFSGQDSVVVQRLAGLWQGLRPDAEASRPHKPSQILATIVGGVGNLVPASEKDLSQKRIQLIRAGFRQPIAASALRGLMVILPIAFVSLVYFTGFYKLNPFLIIACAAALGYLGPDMWLRWKVHQRQMRLRLALPDALDLLVICVESGLGLDQAILRVSQEIRVAHEELSDELQIVNLEMRVGKSRLDALRGLAMRTGVDDIKTLVAMLVQTDRFGTSVAESLRIHSDDLRTRRRQRAEEMAAKTTVKLVLPLVLFIFPALLIVILGPALITIMEEMSTFK